MTYYVLAFEYSILFVRAAVFRTNHSKPNLDTHTHTHTYIKYMFAYTCTLEVSTVVLWDTKEMYKTQLPNACPCKHIIVL